MRKSNLWAVLVLIAAGLLVACASSPTAGKSEKVKPAVLEAVQGTDLSRLVLTAKAAERLDIQVVELRDNAVPYSAVLYGLDGETFVYTNPEPLTFIRAPIVVDYIEGDRAVLLEGPPAGTAVVTVGAAELYGVEFGVGK